MVVIHRTNHHEEVENAEPMSFPNTKEARLASIPQHDSLIEALKAGSNASKTRKRNEEEPIMKVLLCGCGNAVHVLTSYIGRSLEQENRSEGRYEVNVLSLSHSNLLATSVSQDGYIRCTNDVGDDILGKATMISEDPSKVVPGCNVIIFALPTDRHEIYLKAMLPYIQEGTIIGSMPGEGGFDLCVRNVLGSELSEQCTLFTLETLPWACRIQSFGQIVQVLGTKKDVGLCVYPSEQCWNVRDLLQPMIGQYPVIKTSPTSNFLGVTLMNPNAIAHPSILYGLLRNWDGITPFTRPPLFYQAIDDYTANVIATVSNEILAIKAKIQELYPHIDLKLVRTIGEFFEEAYGEDIMDHSSLCKMFNSNKGYDGLTMPTKNVNIPDVDAEGSGGSGGGGSGGGVGYIPLFDHRYLNEDLPCGILVQRGVAELAGVETPVMDKVIVWCQEHAGKEYLVNGKLKGKDIATTKTPQRYGFTDLNTLMKVNGYV